jgi:putative membrane protein
MMWPMPVITGTNGWWMLAGGIWMVIFWGAMLTLVIWGVSKLTEMNGKGRQQETLLDIAKRRYANGEIDKQQLEEIKQNVA